KSMNSSFYEGAGYVSPSGTRAEKKQRQEQWDDSKRQQQASMSDIPEERRYHASTKSRKRADSHQPTSSPPSSRQPANTSPTKDDSVHLRSSYEYQQPRRYSSADYGHAGDTRLGGNFDAPTYVEVERDCEYRRSLKGVEKLRSKFRGLVRT
ncbi:hypothetical protein EK21DRAFT_58365, partial [Setomelanomma holmii]